jgi:hypothetical protein
MHENTNGHTRNEPEVGVAGTVAGVVYSEMCSYNSIEAVEAVEKTDGEVSGRRV